MIPQSTNYKHFCTVFMFMRLYHAYLYYHDSVLQTVEFMKQTQLIIYSNSCPLGESVACSTRFFQKFTQALLLRDHVGAMNNFCQGMNNGKMFYFSCSYMQQSLGKQDGRMTGIMAILLSSEHFSPPLLVLPVVIYKQVQTNASFGH